MQDPWVKRGLIVQTVINFFCWVSVIFLVLTVLPALMAEHRNMKDRHETMIRWAIHVSAMLEASGIDPPPLPGEEENDQTGSAKETP